jgi:DNA-binding transcriptional MerR regulator
VGLLDDTTPPLCTAAELARRLGVTRQQVAVYVREGLASDGTRGKRLLYDEARARRWIAENISSTVGGERPGAGRPRDIPGVDKPDPVDELLDAKGDVEAMKLEGVDVTSAERILEQLNKLSPRQASTLLSTLRAARERHDLDVARSLYVKADDVRAEWAKLIVQCKDRLQEAARAAADGVASTLGCTPEQRAAIENLITARVLEAQTALAAGSEPAGSEPAESAAPSSDASA